MYGNLGRITQSKFFYTCLNTGHEIASQKLNHNSGHNNRQRPRTKSQAKSWFTIQQPITKSRAKSWFTIIIQQPITKSPTKKLFLSSGINTVGKQQPTTKSQAKSWSTIQQPITKFQTKSWITILVLTQSASSNR